MSAYVEVNEAGVVVQQLGRFDLDTLEGPPVPPPEGPHSYHLLLAPIDWRSAPNPDAVLLWEDGNPTWQDARMLSELQLAVIDIIDTLSNAAREKVLVKRTNNIEYQVALADAVKYRDAGFEGVAGPGVTTWTHAKRRQQWSDQDAAENILATAALWEAALMSIRGLRLDLKELVRDATSNNEVDLLLEIFQSTLETAMAGIQ